MTIKIPQFVKAVRWFGTNNKVDLL